MPIPENQLVTWSHQGSITQSSTTYQTIKTALESQSALYKEHSYEIFLQGSYKNSSNIYGESDVDVVIQLNSMFESNIDDLSQEERERFNNSFSDATYSLNNFKSHVTTRMKKAFGTDAIPGNKAIKIKSNGTRRNADVIPAIQYRYYTHYTDALNNHFYEGIKLMTSSGVEVINYPKLHYSNCIKKHQNTNNHFKPVVRIFKNIRQKLIDDKVINKDDAPSYFIEGLIYNVPDELFNEASYSSIVVNILNWLNAQTDKSKFVCPNDMYYLIVDGSNICWNNKDCQKFITATINLWNDWS